MTLGMRAAALALVACGLVALWFSRSAGIGTFDSSVAPPRATATAAVAQKSSLRALPGPIIETRPLASLLPDPTVDSARKMRALHALGDPFAAQLQAASSGDPVLMYASASATLHCFASPVQWRGKDVRRTLTEYSRDPKSGAPIPPDEYWIAWTEAKASAGPQRIVPRKALREEMMRESITWPSEAARPSPERTAELVRLNAAPLSAAERTASDAVVLRARDECLGRMASEDIGKVYRESLDRLVAQGALSAQLFNRRAGWTSGQDRELEPRDYDLLERAFLDGQHDTVARLLLQSPRATGRPDADTWPNDLDLLGAYSTLELALGPLSGCVLGLTDCGAESSLFRSLCMDFGGCDQSDLEALLKYVFRRDGLDPGIIDREIERVLTMYRSRDFAALGYRRKSSG